MQNEKKERTPDQPAVESDCYPPIFAYQLVSLDWPDSSLVLHGALSTSYRVTNLVRVKDSRWRDHPRRITLSLGLSGPGMSLKTQKEVKYERK